MKTELQNQKSLDFSKGGLRLYVGHCKAERGGARYKPMGAPTFLFSKILEKIQGGNIFEKLF
jgi:hypothetical protein